MIHTNSVVETCVCRLICGKDIEDEDADKGTGFLIAPNKVVTATHNIQNYLDDNSNMITLEFLNVGEKITKTALPVSGTSTGAIVILEIDSPVCDCHLNFSDYIYTLGNQYTTFGYPTVKWGQGKWIDSKISRVLGEKDYNPYNWNIDLDHQSPISDFSGLSGAPLMVEGHLVGVLITEALEKGKAITLGAVGVNKFVEILNENNISISEYIDPYQVEIEEDHYKDSLFVEKLIAAQIEDNQFCQEEFFHAEILSESIISKDVKSEVNELNRIKKDVKSLWQSQYLSYSDENNGSELLASVYKQIEQHSDTTLSSRIINVSLYAKKGILHQWSEKCKIGWVKNYKHNLEKYLKAKRS